MYTLTFCDSTAPQHVATATQAIKAAEQHFQCQIGHRARTLKNLRKYGHAIAFHCMSNSFKVFIQKTS